MRELTIAGVILLVMAVIVVVANLRDIIRYLRIRSM